MHWAAKASPVGPHSFLFFLYLLFVCYYIFSLSLVRLCLPILWWYSFGGRRSWDSHATRWKPTRVNERTKPQSQLETSCWALREIKKYIYIYYFPADSSQFLASWNDGGHHCRGESGRSSLPAHIQSLLDILYHPSSHNPPPCPINLLPTPWRVCIYITYEFLHLSHVLKDIFSPWISSSYYSSQESGRIPYTILYICLLNSFLPS